MKRTLLVMFVAFLLVHVGCSAYTHTIRNTTPNQMVIKLIYKDICEANKGLLPVAIKPESTIYVDAHCPINSISASVLLNDEEDNALNSTAFWQAPASGFLGNGTWTFSELKECFVLSRQTICKFAIKKTK